VTENVGGLARPDEAYLTKTPDAIHHRIVSHLIVAGPDLRLGLDRAPRNRAGLAGAEEASEGIANSPKPEGPLQPM
jgi:hypothetical protein